MIIDQGDKEVQNTSLNKYALACALVASMVSIVSGYDTGVMSGAMIFIKEDLGISDTQQEILAGILNLIDVGFFVCFNSFLSLLTVMPTRVVMIVWKLLKTRKFKRLSPVELSDFGYFIIMACGITVLQQIDISFIYHIIRGQATIKLYVIYNVLEPIRSSTGGFGQQAYRPPRGSGGPPQWGQRSSHYGHQQSYDYQHRGPYPSHNQSYAPTPYGNYPQHMAPRSSYGSGWEQRPHQSIQGPPSHNGGYDYYGGQGGHSSEAPSSAQHPSSVPQHGTGPSPLPSMGPSPAQMNYNYGQPQGQDYGHQTPYQQAGHPQQGYGQGYQTPQGQMFCYSSS
ncbi:unnamed protein product [Vicia faba]|uniref:Uncharacterized protein n=2 Tax=Vicia faba TaxID=3906 RepID=A0AAV1B1I3_VICFA|nr:unnamed protein product [Vicia faba]CAI8604225.1 unnamed protein product [Vicia faba]CAI8616420.1 unnamed protein product [Vicia faba]